MSAAPTTPAKMKTRDVVKYIVATLLGLFTFFAIGTLAYAKHRRQNRPDDEGRRIEQRLQTYGDHGALPAKINNDQPATQ